MNYTTEVYERKEGDYNPLYNKTTINLHERDDINLSKTLCNKLLKFAINEFKELGFPIFENVEISTMDANDNVYDREYQIDFKNEKGYGFSIFGIAFVGSKNVPEYYRDIVVIRQ